MLIALLAMCASCTSAQAAWLTALASPTSNAVAPEMLSAGQTWSDVAQRWEWDDVADENATATPLVVVGNEAYDVLDGTLMAFSTDTGAELWSYSSSTGITSGLDAYGGRLWADSGDQVLTFALSCTTSCLPHVFASGLDHPGTPLAVQDVVVVPSSPASGGADLTAYSRTCTASCTPVWIYHTAGAFSPPSISNGLVWVGSAGGRLIAFPTACGSPCTFVRKVGNGTGGSLTGSPPVLSGNRIYVVGSDGYLYAYPTDCTSGCPAVWRSSAGSYEAPVVVGHAHVFVVQQTAGPPYWQTEVDAYSTGCSPSAGVCKPRFVAAAQPPDNEVGPIGIVPPMTLTGDTLLVNSVGQDFFQDIGEVIAVSASCVSAPCPETLIPFNNPAVTPLAVSGNALFAGIQNSPLGGTNPAQPYAGIVAYAVPASGP